MLGKCSLKSIFHPIIYMKNGHQLARNFSKSKSIDLKGIFPPIATAFNCDESVAVNKLEENLQKWSTIPFAGLVVQGSNGEYPLLEKNERIDLVKIAKQFTTQNGKLLIAGSGCESTKATISMTENMASAGADAVMVVTPSYYKNQMSDSALINFYKIVADSSPVPVILYSVPGNTGIDLSSNVIQVLSTHPNIIGLKDSGGDITKLGNLVYKTKSNDFQILAGSAGFLLPSLAVGCVGGVCALANVLGDHLCQLHSSFVKNVYDKDLQHRLIEPNMMVTKRFGVAGLKIAMELFGYYGGPTRSPLLGLTEQEKNVVKQSFVANGFL